MKLLSIVLENERFHVGYKEVVRRKGCLGSKISFQMVMIDRTIEQTQHMDGRHDLQLLIAKIRKNMDEEQKQLHVLST